LNRRYRLERAASWAARRRGQETAAAPSWRCGGGPRLAYRPDRRQTAAAHLP